MPETLTEQEKRVLAVLQEGFPLSPTPYADMATRIGMDVEALLGILRGWKDQGKIRRMGAIVNHFKVGMGGGAMVVWNVPVERVKRVGEQLAGFKEVSHAYQRPSAPNWPYTLYTMVHGSDNEEAAATVERMSQACGVEDYRLLKTVKELKKEPPVYIK
jgi:siroheme decarboxylase